jgi:hypothetical protein
MPGLTLIVLDDGNIDLLKEPSAIPVAESRVSLPPTGHYSIPSFEGDSFWRQTNRKNIVCESSCFVQLEDCNIKAIRMRSRKPEVRMKSDFGNIEVLRWFVLEPVIFNVMSTDDDGQLMEWCSVGKRFKKKDVG